MCDTFAKIIFLSHKIPRRPSKILLHTKENLCLLTDAYAPSPPLSDDELSAEDDCSEELDELSSDELELSEEDDSSEDELEEDSSELEDSEEEDGLSLEEDSSEELEVDSSEEELELEGSPEPCVTAM
jgi:hypothetical protein